VPELGVLSSDLGNSSNGYGHALGLVKVVGFSCQVLPSCILFVLLDCGGGSLMGCGI